MLNITKKQECFGGSVMILTQAGRIPISFQGVLICLNQDAAYLLTRLRFTRHPLFAFGGKRDKYY
jgi:hypothetical protein